MLSCSTYTTLISNLVQYDTGPFSLRWGGNAQDLMDLPYEQRVWDSLRDFYLKSDRKVRYIIGKAVAHACGPTQSVSSLQQWYRAH